MTQKSHLRSQLGGLLGATISVQWILAFGVAGEMLASV